MDTRKRTCERTGDGEYVYTAPRGETYTITQS